MTTARATNPTAKDRKPATMPLSTRTPRTPLMRAWIAVMTPIATAPPSARGAGMRRAGVTSRHYRSLRAHLSSTEPSPWRTRAPHQGIVLQEDARQPADP